MAHWLQRLNNPEPRHSRWWRFLLLIVIIVLVYLLPFALGAAILIMPAVMAYHTGDGLFLWLYGLYLVLAFIGTALIVMPRI